VGARRVGSRYVKHVRRIASGGAASYYSLGNVLTGTRFRYNEENDLGESEVTGKESI